MKVILVAGALANKCRNGGGAWERMSWVVGLRQLGFDVYFVEQIAPQACVSGDGEPTDFAESVNLAWFRFVTEWFGVADRSALVCGEGEHSAGIDWPRLLELASEAELLINLGGHLSLSSILQRVRRSAYIDVDPGFTQFWHADPNLPFCIAEHDFYFTIGENIGSPQCSIPTGGIRWRPVRQPVVLDDWPVARSSPGRFTTVASWRGAYGPVIAEGRRYGVKAHEFRKLLELPQRASASFEIALDISPADDKDRRALQQHGWQLTDPREMAGDPAAFRRYIQQSAAEFSVAQGIYVETNSGWFSDRSVRYLASGKPVLVQDTGIARLYPTGQGLVTFRTLDEAARSAEAIAADYDAQCQAARSIAERYLAADVVLARFLEEVGVAP